MPYAIKQLTDLPAPVVVIQLIDPIDTVNDLPAIFQAVDASLATIPGNMVLHIIDLSRMTLHFGDMAQTLAMIYSPRSGMRLPHVQDARVKSILVAEGTLSDIAVSSLRQDQYGNRQVERFATLNEALSFVRQMGTG